MRCLIAVIIGSVDLYGVVALSHRRSGRVGTGRDSSGDRGNDSDCVTTVDLDVACGGVDSRTFVRDGECERWLG